MHALCFSELLTYSENKDAFAQLPAQPKVAFGNETSSGTSCHKPSHCLPTASHAGDQTTGLIQDEDMVSHRLVLPMKYSEILTEINSTEA